MTLPRVQQFAYHAERGASTLTTIIFGAIFIAIVYSGYKIIPFFYCYFELENQMYAVARIASTATDTEIRKKLIYHIKKLEIPVDPEKLNINRDGETITISLPYEEIFYISMGEKDYDIHTFKFIARVSEKY